MKFSINVAAGAKKRKGNNTGTVVSRLLLATTIIENGELKASIEKPDRSFLVLPFTSKSFDIKGRTMVFSKVKEHGKNVRIIRDKSIANNFGGNYITLIANEAISGHIMKINGALYFDYNECYGRANAPFDIPQSLLNKNPIFNNEYRSD